MFKSIVKYPHLKSINEAKKIGRSGNKVWMYMNPEVTDMMNKIIFEMKKNGSEEYFRPFKANPADWCFEVELNFVLNTNYWGRDVTNFIKYVEDAISKATGIDDSLHHRVSVQKYHNPESAVEAIVIVIKEKPKASTIIDVKDL